LAAIVATIHVIALGGSLLRPEEAEMREQWFSRLKQMVVHLEGMQHSIGIVVGGGAPAREGIEVARKHIKDESKLDKIGIAATRLNASIIQQVLAEVGIDVAEEIPSTISHAADLLQSHSIVCMGGTVPGHTTDAVATSLAIEAGAEICIIATNVSHVYDSDPRVNEEAQSFTEMSLAQLGEICGIGTPLPAGTSAVVDPIAVERAISASLDLAVLDGRQMDRLENAILGLEFEGSKISA
jgi:uridylate kinase